MPEAFDQAEWLNSVRPYFVSETAERLSELQALRKRILKDCDVEQSATAICGIAHKIAGTADSFGYTCLGVAAQQLEEQLNAKSEGNGQSEPVNSLEGLITLLDNLIAELSSVLKRVE